jgi:hypothetical protein
MGADEGEEPASGFISEHRRLSTADLYYSCAFVPFVAALRKWLLTRRFVKIASNLGVVSGDVCSTILNHLARICLL